jgi:hypothetical protein
VLDESRGYAVIGAEHQVDPVVPLRRAVEGVAELMQGVEKLEAEPSESNLRDLAWELAEVKGSIQSLGRSLMLSQDPTIAGSAHELLVEAGEVICSGQQRVKTTLRRIGATSDVSDAGSVAVGTAGVSQPLPARASRPIRGLSSPFRWRSEQARGCMEDAGRASGGQESKLATLILCINGAQANDSSWPVFLSAST